jgi:hypothetical protein
MKQQSSRKKELDLQRTEWRKTHRTLNGRIILYPDKPPEHINARGSKVYSWFWGKTGRNRTTRSGNHGGPQMPPARGRQPQNTGPAHTIGMATMRSLKPLRHQIATPSRSSINTRV